MNLNNLKQAAMKKFGLVDPEAKSAEEPEVQKMKASTPVSEEPTKGQFAVVQDADGNYFNVEGEMITVGQEFKTGDVEGEGDIVADAETTLDSGSVIITDSEGIISEIQMAPASEGEEEQTEGGSTEQSQNAKQETPAFSQADFSNAIADAYKKGAQEVLSLLEPSFANIKEASDSFNSAPAATRKTATVRKENKYNSDFAAQLENSHLNDK